MIAYKNDEALRQKYIDRAEQHRAADEIIQGSYWDGKRGCCIGCLAETSSRPHYKLQEDAGIPVIVSRLADGLHERLTPEKSKLWPGRFAAAIKTGSDLSLVAYGFFHWYLTEENGIRRNASPETREAIDGAADMIARRLKGDTISTDEWAEKWNALNDRWYAALDALDARAARAALDALDALDARAARAALDALDALDARQKAFDMMAEKFIELVEAAPAAKGE